MTDTICLAIEHLALADVIASELAGANTPSLLTLP